MIKEIIEEKNLKGYRLLIYLLIKEYKELKISLRDFSSLLGVGVTTIMKYTSELEREGFIKIERCKNSKEGCLYTLAENDKVNKKKLVLKKGELK